MFEELPKAFNSNDSSIIPLRFDSNNSDNSHASLYSSLSAWKVLNSKEEKGGAPSINWNSTAILNQKRQDNNLVIVLAIIYQQVYICTKISKSCILFCLDFLLYSRQVNWVTDNFEVIWICPAEKNAMGTRSYQKSMKLV